MKFTKYHGLGNDYIVIHQSEVTLELSPQRIRRICDRNLGPGSDGIILIEAQTSAGFIVRIFNPDGSEAENSGNGMRIAARYLFDTGRVGSEQFSLLVKGERLIRAQIHDPQSAITVDMGRATFLSTEIPVAGVAREVIGETLEILSENLTINCVSVGNPHCVIVGRSDIKDGAKRLGPYIEVHENFPNRTNVQFVQVIDRAQIRIEIWERGAGYTLASGSSASAAACVCRKLGLVDSPVTVTMPGGQLEIALNQDYSVTLTGPVVRVFDGVIDREIFDLNTEKDGLKAFALSELIATESCAKETEARLARGEADGVKITGITSDSRQVKPGDIFFAIQGSKSDARLLINEAFDRGAASVVYEGVLPVAPKGIVIPVVDIRRALSYAAHRFFGKPSHATTNIGITGTSGKTSVAWIVAHALNFLGSKTFLGGTLGYSMIGPSGAECGLSENTTVDPITVQRLLADALDRGAQSTVFEVTSQGVVQRRMRDIAWDGVVFTNLSRDHLDLHGTMEAYEAAKSELFTTDLATSPKNRRFAVINVDDAAGARLASTLRNTEPTIALTTIAMDTSIESDYYISNLHATVAGLSFNLAGREERIEIRTPFIGTHNAYNTGCAALVLRALGSGPHEIAQAIAAVPVVPGRLELAADSSVSVFIDYAHKPDALEKVLQFLKPLCGGRLITVFGCGGDRDAGKRPIMGEISYRLADLTVITSDNPRSEDPQLIIDQILSGMPSPIPGRVYVEIDRKKAIEYAISVAQPGDVVLIAGKGHEPYQEVRGVKYPFSDIGEARRWLNSTATENNCGF
jgi:UDP-N-acetylmuramoyl-L-alanyl-D-glutamate--2,6-diaminopimelate ligase